MSSRRLKLPEPRKLIRGGIVAQSIGVIVLAISLFTLVPAVMVVTVPLGAGLILLGWLGWAIVFFRHDYWARPGGK